MEETATATVEAILAETTGVTGTAETMTILVIRRGTTTTAGITGQGGTTITEEMIGMVVGARKGLAGMEHLTAGPQRLKAASRCHSANERLLVGMSMPQDTSNILLSRPSRLVSDECSVVLCTC